MKNIDFGARQTWIPFEVLLFLAEWCKKSYLTFLNLDFLICERGIISTLQLIIKMRIYVKYCIRVLHRNRTNGRYI